MFLRTLVLAAILATPAAAEPIRIVAAETFYGEVAGAIGGDRVAVESVAISPDADPHDFAPPPSVARSVADADVVIMNGLDYDHWMVSLLEASPNDHRVVIDVAALVDAAPGSNPHLWYDPRAVPALAAALETALGRLDADGAPDFAAARTDYAARLDALAAKVSSIRDRFAGTRVTASEPVFGPMAEALGLEMLGEDFQRAVMNETEPSARAIAEVEDDIRTGRARVLFYNRQVVDPMTERLLQAAQSANIPVVAVTESMPEGGTYVAWMLDQLEATERALAAPAS